MPALERHVRLAGEVKNQQNSEPHQVNEGQTVAITGWTMFAMPEPRDGLMKEEGNGKQWNPDIGHPPFYPLRQHYIGGPAAPTADYTKE
jgi:hypothetical protein